MNTRHARSTAFAAAAITGLASGELISINLTPDEQLVNVGDVVEIDLVLASEGPGAQSFDTVDAVFTWDPTQLELVGHDDSDAGASWLLSGFLPDPDGVNVDHADGTAIFSALAAPGSEVTATVDGLIVTTLQFEALEATTLTEIELLATIGVFGESRALLAGANVTGALGGPAGVTALDGCAADCAQPSDGVVDVSDLLAIFSSWGTANGACDIDGDGVVATGDLIVLLASWGVCP